MGTAADINVIAENLTELLRNSVNMTSVFYDIFLNPEPMDIELSQIGEDGEVVVISIPNRAKDMILATVGVGSPEGRVTAGVGKIYVDSQSLACYVKATGTGSTGWRVILTEQGVYAYIDNYLRESNFIDYEKLGNYLTTYKYTTESQVSEIIARTVKAQSYTLLASSGNILLDDNSVYKINPTGSINFALPTITDLTQTHRIFIQMKLDSASYSINLGCANYYDRVPPSFTSTGMYNIWYEYDVVTRAWVCGSVLKGTSSNWSLATLKGYVSTLQSQMATANNNIAAIRTVIPSAATASNQLADKQFVNSSIATNTSNFIGTFNSVAELEAYSGTVTNNDYAFVTSTDSAGNTIYNRYKYNGSAWVFEYALNNSSFTAAQWSAINSSITAALTAQIATNELDISDLQDRVSAIESGAAVQASYDATTENIIFSTST